MKISYLGDLILFLLNMKQFVKCPNCKDISKHFETKTIFRTPDNMIIFFDRSQLKKYNVKIDFDEQIMFNKTQVQSNFNKEYNLLGINQYFSIM